MIEIRSETVAVIGKGRTSEVRIAFEEQHGQSVVDVRTYAQYSAAKLYGRTARGFSLPISQLPDLAAGIADTLHKARERGLIGGDA